MTEAPAPEFEHVQNIRIGTKALAYWPQRFVSDKDADDCLELFEEVAAADRHLAVMGHYSHPVELESGMAREAVRRVRNTGAQIRMQGPLIRHVNDDPEAWASLWTTGVRLGLIPYYMFIERDTGARSYFEVPLVRAFEIFKCAYSQVSGLSRSVRGPSMSAFPGKVRVLGVVTLRDMMDRNVLQVVRESAGFELLGDPDRPLLVCDFVQARDPAWVRKPFFAEFDERAAWCSWRRRSTAAADDTQAPPSGRHGLSQRSSPSRLRQNSCNSGGMRSRVRAPCCTSLG